MSVVLAVILWAVAVLCALLLVVVLVPISAEVRGEIEGLSANGDARVMWGAGLVSVRVARGEGGQLRLLGLPVFRFRMEKKPVSKETLALKKDRAKRRAAQKAEKREKAIAKGKPPRGFRWALRNWRLFRRLLATLRLRGHLVGLIGTGDPADTALVVFRVFAPLNRRGRRFDIDVQPDYVDEVVELEGAVQLRFWPMAAVGVLLSTLINTESRRALLSRG
ncbi:MAG: hypothetical protein KC561_01580 [Myxococcales bacterium]|nr:hypothetical protein [Myxococcales bacterium]